MVKSKMNFVLYGVGEIGTRLFNVLELKEGVQCVGAVDIDPEKCGNDIGILSGAEEVGVIVKDDIEKVLEDSDPDLVFHTTASHLGEVERQIKEMLNNRLNVISSCEEMAYPAYSSPKLAKDFDKMAEANNVSVLGTGINPGFLMDTLPMVLTGVSQEVEKIKVNRRIDAAKRREPFQKKIGSGLTVDSFANQKDIGHVGLPESMSLIASAVGWSLDGINIGEPEPITAEKTIITDYLTVKSGQVSGLTQTAEGKKGEVTVIELNFTASLNNEEEFDEIVIEGVPQINQKISPSINGDIGTVSMLANLAPHVVNSSAGLITMKDVVSLTFFRGLRSTE